MMASLGLLEREFYNLELELNMKHSICLEMFFEGESFTQKIRNVHEMGFDSIEFWSSEDKNIPEVLNVLQTLGLKCTNFSGHRKGNTFDPSLRVGFTQELISNLSKAKTLSCPNLMILADELSDDGSVKNPNNSLSLQEKIENTTEFLRELAPIAKENNVTLVLEPLNTKVDHLGYWLNSSYNG
jgi:hydroxypyruvate isomerase